MEEGLLPLPARLATWPAVVLLFGFTWLELVVPDAATLPVLHIATATYAGVMLLGAAVFGSGWFDAADPFEAWSGAFARLAPVARAPDGHWVVRSPLSGMTALPASAATVGLVSVMLGSTAWDSWAGSTRWIAFVQSSSHRMLWGTAGLLAAICTVAVVFSLTTAASGRAVPQAGSVRKHMLPGLFAHTLVPIALGYVVAHYYSFLVYQGQRTLILATDPLQTGADYLGLRDSSISTALIRPRFVAALQVVAVVTGHVAGVVLAHDRAVRLFERRQAIAGQLPLLVLMVGITLGGLLLLFHG